MWRSNRAGLRSSPLSQARAFLAVGLVLGVALSGGDALCAPQIIKGPYLQQVTQDSMVVMWETDEAAPSRVDYGLAAPGERFVEDPSPHTIHEVTLTGLATGTAYRYNVTSGATTSVASTFATAPEFPQPFRMVVYGDSRSYPATHAAVAAGIAASRPDIVLHTGDLVSGGAYGEFGQQFFTPARDLMLDTPLLPSLGNHEDNSSWYFDLLSLPGNERWFAFTYGCARIICLDTNASHSPGSAQHNWLLSELTSAECAAAAWRIVYFHHPPYSATAKHGDDWGVRLTLVPFFEQHRVNVVFSGHSHAYERYANNGIVYIVTGGGGAPLHGLQSRIVPPTRLAGASVYHFVVADITTASMRIAARRSNGKDFDAIEFLAPNDPPAAAPDAYATDEDAALNVPAPGVLGNDTDPDRNPLRAVLVAGVQHGALAFNPDGSFVYVPDANHSGADSFTYRANDGRADSPAVTVDIAVNAVNDPPVARADAALTEQGAAANLPVLANDSDADGDPLAITALTQPPNGLATHDGATVTYTPAPGYAGTDTFTYTARDGSGATASATVSVLVVPYARPDIHGRIADGAGNGIAGATVKLKGLYGTKWKGEALTDALGFYTFGNLPLGTYSVKPKLKGWQLAPRSLEVPLAAPTDHAPADFTGTAK